MEQDKIKKKTKHPLKNEHEIKQASKNPGIHNCTPPPKKKKNPKGLTNQN